MLGIAIMLILYFTKNFTGLNLAINKITIAISGVFGIVGIIALLFFNLIVWCTVYGTVYMYNSL